MLVLTGNITIRRGVLQANHYVLKERYRTGGYMKKNLTKLIIVLFVLVTAIALAACGGSSSSSKGAFKGELIDAQNNRIVIKNADETMLFSTTDKTKYNLQDENELCVGDEISVNYHEGEGTFVADSVSVKDHKYDFQVFGGEVTELGKSHLTVQSESLTVVFEYGKDTKFRGKLSKGDAVTITYKGDLSEDPYAVSIVVVKERKEKEEKSIHGTVSETAQDSILVSVDSAHACRIRLTKDTVIGGDDTKVKVGDEVHLVYVGTAGEEPVAKSIKIKRKKDQEYFVMDGVIDQVSNQKMVVRTAKNHYSFKLVEATRIQNPKYLKAGHMTTITYVGKLGKNATAASIFCSEDTVDKVVKKKTKKTATSKTEKKKAAKKTAKKKTAKKKNKSEAATKKKAKSAEKKKDVKPSGSGGQDNGSGNNGSSQTNGNNGSAQPEKKNTDNNGSEKKSGGNTPSGGDKNRKGGNDKKDKTVAVKAKGEILEWGSNPAVFKIDGGATLRLDIKDAEISGGYIPEEGDQVIITYDKEKMKLIDLQLEYRLADEETKAQSTDNTTKDTTNDNTNNTSKNTTNNNTDNTSKDTTVDTTNDNSNDTAVDNTNDNSNGTADGTADDTASDNSEQGV